MRARVRWDRRAADVESVHYGGVAVAIFSHADRGGPAAAAAEIMCTFVVVHLVDFVGDEGVCRLYRRVHGEPEDGGLPTAYVWGVLFGPTVGKILWFFAYRFVRRQDGDREGVLWFVPAVFLGHLGVGFFYSPRLRAASCGLWGILGRLSFVMFIHRRVRVHSVELRVVIFREPTG